MGTMYHVDTGAWVRAQIAPLDGRDDDEKLGALVHEMVHSELEDPRIIDAPWPDGAHFHPATQSPGLAEMGSCRRYHYRA